VLTLLKGLVGSHAYGLANEFSDEDYLGIYVDQTVKLLGLHPGKNFVEDHDPDLKMYEAKRYIELAFNCNPTVLELLWLPEYTEVQTFGMRLIKLRNDFLNAQGVRNAYLGYATQQFKRITMRGDRSFSSDTRKRTAKHARHLYRLCESGYQLWSTGEMQLRVDDPEKYHEFGRMVAEGHLEYASVMLSDYATKFDTTKSALPKRSNEKAIEEWLIDLRDLFFWGTNDWRGQYH
jgi:hypothetical protein